MSNELTESSSVDGVPRELGGFSWEATVNLAGPLASQNEYISSQMESVVVVVGFV
jgi:hypothetical protein